MYIDACNTVFYRRKHTYKAVWSQKIKPIVQKLTVYHCKMYVRTCTGLTEQVDDLTTWTEYLVTLLIKVHANCQTLSKYYT